MARPILALLGAALTAWPAAAQPVEAPGDAPAPVSYALLQISLVPGKVASGAFRTRMEAVRSCPEAVKAANEMGAEVVRNAHVTPDRLPPKLEILLRDLPVGRATPVFSGSGNTLRVLVLCQRG
ncbi:MAG: hypothetical protein ACKO01_04975 [Erythrobacter sp.]